MRALLRRAVGRLVGAVSDHPLRAAGGVAAAAGAVVTVLGAQAQTRAQAGADAGTGATTGGGVTATAAVEFSLAHPAYPAAVVVGLAVLLLAR